MMSAEMPSWYFAGVKAFYTSESLLAYDRLEEAGGDASMKDHMLRQETLDQLESCDNKKLLSQVLEMLPTLHITQNADQKKIIDAT